jgi:hypothetical protein
MANVDLAARRARHAPHAPDRADSIQRRKDRARSQPFRFGALLGWFREEWLAEIPARIHERGVEPDSALGSPRLSGAMRHRADVLDNPTMARATDYDRQHDTWSTGEAPRMPVLAALEALSCGSAHRIARPLTAHYLRRLAYAGFDWRFLADREHQPVEVRELYTKAALEELWQVWASTELNVVKELV